MRHAFTFAVTVILAGTASCSPASQPSSSTTDADRRAITQLVEEENGGFLGKDVEKVLATYTADVIMMPPNEPPIRGKEALRPWFQKGFSQEGFVADRGVSDDLQIAGDWAVERLILRSATKDQATGKVVHVYRREADGSWKIAQDIWNDDMAATPSK